MGKHAGQPRLSDQAITDQARACAEEIRAAAGLYSPDERADEHEQILRGYGITAASPWRLLGRALALLEIMAGDTK